MTCAEMRTKSSAGRSGGPNPAATGDPNPSDNHSVYQDLHMYIVLCKGNVYQSCGDDEQAMLHYMEVIRPRLTVDLTFLTALLPTYLRSRDCRKRSTAATRTGRASE